MSIKKTKAPDHYRQGDFVLMKIKAIPSGAVKEPTAKSIVLGEGETAGHRHELLEIDKVQAYRQAEGFYLSVAQETELVHPDHGQIALMPGTYEVIRQHEFQRKEVVRVQD